MRNQDSDRRSFDRASLPVLFVLTPYEGPRSHASEESFTGLCHDVGRGGFSGWIARKLSPETSHEVRFVDPQQRLGPMLNRAVIRHVRAEDDGFIFGAEFEAPLSHLNALNKHETPAC